jgi:hypothetical protein
MPAAPALPRGAPALVNDGPMDRWTPEEQKEEEQRIVLMKTTNAERKPGAG